MSFDAFFTRAVVCELSRLIVGARVEKVLQPSKDEIFLLLHRENKHFRLQLNASASAPRIGITSESPENPLTPPVFCMLLRKHLTGAKVSAVYQHGLERAVAITFETYDELGFFTARHLICEIMGRCSNIILCADASENTGESSGSAFSKQLRIIACVKPVDFTTSSKRQLLPGMLYELPPIQDKLSPFEISRDDFISMLGASDKSRADFLTSSFLGFSPLLSKELDYRAGDSDGQGFADTFFNFISQVKSESFSPFLFSEPDGSPKEFYCFELKQFSDKQLDSKALNSFGELCDAFFAVRERLSREKSRAAATLRLVSNAESRLSKKLAVQRKELAESEKGEEYRKKADLITANIYLIKRGDTAVTLTDYSDCREDGSYGEVKLMLDARLTPSQNAQRLYKKYAKSKNAREQLTLQIENGERELAYIRSVADALSRINGQADLDEIRRELAESGYDRANPKRSDSFSASNGNEKNRKNAKKQKLPPQRPPKKYITENGGFTVLVGRNNTENDRLTFRIADKTDLWFHVKNVPGSHTVLILNGREPTEEAIAEAAVIAAQNSSAASDGKATVDYTAVKNVKKPSGAKPGFVIYNTYRQIVVSPQQKTKEIPL